MEDSGHFVIVNGGTKKQRQLVHNITGWFCNKFFNRFKSYNIEFMNRCHMFGADFTPNINLFTR